MKAQRRHVRAVIFDLDDCLYPERDYVRGGYRAVADSLRDKTGRADDFAAWLWRRFLAGQAAGALDALNREFSLGLAPGQVQELVGVYRAHLPAIEPYGGMIEMLGRLRARYLVGLLSDGFVAAQRLKVQALGIERFLDAIVFTDELGREFWKPSSRGFELIAQRLGAEPGACAYVGDNPAKDFVAPNSLGWLSIQIVWPGQVHAGNVAPPGGQPAIVVRDLEELYRAVLD